MAVVAARFSRYPSARTALGGRLGSRHAAGMESPPEKIDHSDVGLFAHGISHEVFHG